MGTLGFVSQQKKYLILFLNVSFLLVGSVILLVTYFTSSEFLVSSSFDNNQQDCKVLEKLDGYKAKCLYLKSGNRCVSQGYIDYLYLFYCCFGRFPFLGYFLVFLWLLVLFYLLGNTASEYFCSSLESLSRLLDLSPTIAGVTLLSLGNGAPDVFASLVSFMGSGTSDIGLNTVLGAASFVTCVVVGTICICLHKRRCSSEQICLYQRRLLPPPCSCILSCDLDSRQNQPVGGNWLFLDVCCLCGYCISLSHLLSYKWRRK
ncbi:hypothetical protein Patl1_23520 [Pistacia atlantica]|uniref:Uncharacterized protein n=1 Tax=Pistacia atlantica TaxID=434234 RepID=A0ACC0ZUX3_9ROSI|nr:hypothetical protein Patl1_23520 [Pistacia atlantica]